ncbi:hypothetical protein AWENTII_013018 [Aspergillus wentii]
MSCWPERQMPRRGLTFSCPPSLLSHTHRLIRISIHCHESPILIICHFQITFHHLNIASHPPEMFVSLLGRSYRRIVGAQACPRGGPRETSGW